MSEISKDDQATAEAFALVGEAITRWSFVELTLCNIFTVCISSCPARPPRVEGDPGMISFLDSQITTAVFYSTESFRGKLSIVDAAIAARLNAHGQWASDLKSDWAKLRESTRKLSLKRNSLAHGTVTPAFDDGEDFHEAALMPPYGSPAWWTETGLRPTGKKRTPKQLRELIDAFLILDDKLRTYEKTLAHHSRLHGKFDGLMVRQIRSLRRLNPTRAEWIEQQLSSPE